MKRVDIIAAMITVIAWGSNYVAISYVVSEMPGFLSIAVRLLITFLCLALFVPFPKIKFKDLYFISTVFGGYLGLLYYGLHLGLNTSLTIILMQLNIPISIVVARFMLDEKFTSLSIAGVGIAFLGAMVVVGSPAISGNAQALFSVLAASILCALFNVKSRQFNHINPMSLVCWTGAIAAPQILIASFFIDGNPIAFLKETTHLSWIATAYSVVIASFLCQGLWIYLLQKYPLHQILPYNLLVPFVGISCSVMYLGDLPSWHVILGGILTISGIAVSQARHMPFFRNKKL